jgi:hypothetical protein
MQTRSAIARMNNVEMSATAKLMMLGPSIFSVAASFATNEISANAVVHAMANIRAQARHVMTPWEHRAAGLTETLIWDFVLMSVCSGFSTEFLKATLMSPHFDACCRFSNAPGPSTKIACDEEIKKILARETINLSETTLSVLDTVAPEIIEDDTESIPERMARTPDIPISTEEMRAMLGGAAIRGSFAAQLPNQPGSLMGAPVEEEEGFA